MVSDDRTLNQELIEIVDKLLSNGQWDGGLFLKASEKKLQALRERLVEGQTYIDEKTAQQQEIKEPTQSLQSNLTQVYITLYQSEGLNLRKWEALLASLSNSSMSRPIYKTLEDVDSFMRGKLNSPNDAYVVVKVSEDDILPSLDPPSVDKSGRLLLQIKEKSIFPRNIEKFIHSTGEYIYKNGGLSKIS